MASLEEITKMLRRCDRVYRQKVRSDEELGALAVEWERIIGKYPYDMLDEALTAYIEEDDGGSYARAPRPGEIKQICLEKRRRIQSYNSLNTSGKCFLCSGSGKVLVDAAKSFYGNYSGLGVKCPCNNPGELLALQNGQRVTRYVRGGRMELWLEHDRLYGVLHEFRVKQKPEAWPPRGAEQKRKAATSAPVNIFDNWQAELEEPPF